jgi:hypothetical protein
MRAVAFAFSREMDRVGAFLDAIEASYAVAKEDPTGVLSNRKFVVKARKLRKTIQGCSDLNVVAFAGAYLHVCAEYELTLRCLIERYIEAATVKCAQYHHLPETMREWYPAGCAEIIRNIKQDKFKHLTVTAIVASLASTTRNSSYNLIGDAFSDNQWNFGPSTIDGILDRRLGIPKIWQKLARETELQTAVRTKNLATVEQLAKARLSNLLQRRNDTIHRGKSYYTPSESEVRDCIQFLKPLVMSLAEVLEKQFLAL